MLGFKKILLSALSLSLASVTAMAADLNDKQLTTLKDLADQYFALYLKNRDLYILPAKHQELPVSYIFNHQYLPRIPDDNWMTGSASGIQEKVESRLSEIGNELTSNYLREKRRNSIQGLIDAQNAFNAFYLSLESNAVTLIRMAHQDAILNQMANDERWNHHQLIDNFPQLIRLTQNLIAQREVLIALRASSIDDLNRNIREYSVQAMLKRTALANNILDEILQASPQNDEEKALLGALFWQIIYVKAAIRNTIYDKYTFLNLARHLAHVIKDKNERLLAEGSPLQHESFSGQEAIDFTQVKNEWEQRQKLLQAQPR